MKKILTHLTGIVFLITILLAGSCKQASKDDPDDKLKKVEIYCKAYEVDGVMHFEMYDSNDKTKASDTLVTDVLPRTRVTWIWEADSEADEFVKIGPKTPFKIITKNAKKVLFSNKFKYRVPRDAPRPSVKEKYDIEFKDKDDNIVLIDPYLKIPPKTSGGEEGER